MTPDKLPAAPPLCAKGTVSQSGFLSTCAPGNPPSGQSVLKLNGLEATPRLLEAPCPLAQPGPQNALCQDPNPTPPVRGPGFLNTGRGAHTPRSPDDRAGCVLGGCWGSSLPVQTPCCRMKPAGHQARPPLLRAPGPSRREAQAWWKALGAGARGRSQDAKGARWLTVVTFCPLRSSGVQTLPSRRGVWPGGHRQR